MSFNRVSQFFDRTAVGFCLSAAEFRFADFELDVRGYELRRGGQPIRLERQPMD